jgi:hypothetical protein
MAGADADPMLTELPRRLFEILCDFIVSSVLLAQQFTKTPPPVRAELSS